MMVKAKPPITELIDALPERVRSYIYRLKVAADPAYIIQDNFRLREENAMLRAECERLAKAAEHAAHGGGKPSNSAAAQAKAKTQKSPRQPRGLTGASLGRKRPRRRPAGSR